jgi:hypothetical protein
MLWTDKTIYERITDRLTERKRLYDRHVGDRELIAQYFRLDLDIEVDEETNSLILGHQIYEGTAPWAARVMATGFQGKLMSKSIDWLLYKMGNMDLQGIDELDIWCQNIKEHMADVYQRGNFYDVQPNFTLDGLTVGSPVMFPEEDISTGRVMWLPTHFRQAYVFYDRYNQPEGVIVEDDTWTAKMLDDAFCKVRDREGRQAEREKLFTKDLAENLKRGNFSQKYKVYRAVFKSTDPIWEGEDFKKPVGKPPWISVYFQEGCEGTKQNDSLETKPCWARPFVVWDYNKKPWYAVSSTPAYEAYHDVVCQQQVHKNYIEGVQLRTRQPMVYLDTQAGRLDLGAGGMMGVTPAEYDKPPKRIEGTAGDIVLDAQLSDRLSKACERHFHLDQLLVFMRRLEQRQSPLTATEAIKLEAESVSFLSPFIESHSRYLSDCDDVASSIERLAGRGPFAPDIMANITDIVVENSKSQKSSIRVIPEFVGPLHRAQKLAQAIEPITTGTGLVAQIAQNLGDPDLPRLMFKSYQTADKALEAINFPQDCIETEETYNASRDALTQARMEAEERKQALEAAKVVPGLGKRLEEGSPAEALVGANIE